MDEARLLPFEIRKTPTGHVFSLPKSTSNSEVQHKNVVDQTRRVQRKMRTCNVQSKVCRLGVHLSVHSQQVL